MPQLGKNCAKAFVVRVVPSTLRYRYVSRYFGHHSYQVLPSEEKYTLAFIRDIGEVVRLRYLPSLMLCHSGYRVCQSSSLVDVHVLGGWLFIRWAVSRILTHHSHRP